jgi:AcrR family transcriptional regulator
VTDHRPWHPRTVEADALPSPPRPRRPRRDAEANRERLLAAAVSAMLREGRNVPLATIAAEAGVGVGTLYRKYADRTELLHALEHRAYGLLNGILDDIERLADEQRWSGLDCVAAYVTRSIEISDQLVLPLHGAPPLLDDAAVTARRDINRRLDAFIARGTADRTIRSGINASDIIVFTALVTQPFRHGPDWTTLVERQKVVFLNGLTAHGPILLPDRQVVSADFEQAFTDQTTQGT